MRNGIHPSGDFGADMLAAVTANPIVLGPIVDAPPRIAPNLFPLATALFTDGASISLSQVASALNPVSPGPSQSTTNPAQNNLQLLVNGAMGLMTLYFVYTFWSKKLARMK